ncbi:SH3 domain-containing protein [Roseomonas sp. WA12]
MKILKFMLVGLVGLFILGSLLPKREETQDDRDRYTVGYLATGQCMSGQNFNDRAARWLDGSDWSNVPGAATFGRDVKILVAGTRVMDAMMRLGVKACPDLDHIFQAYVATQAPRPDRAPALARPAMAPPATPSVAASGASLRMRITGNVRAGAGQSNPVVRVAQAGEELIEFGRDRGWVRVGKSEPEGWVAESLITR